MIASLHAAERLAERCAGIDPVALCRSARAARACDFEHVRRFPHYRYFVARWGRREYLLVVSHDDVLITVLDER